MYNLIGYSSNYGFNGLWFYLKDEVTNFNADIANDNNFKSFIYKAKLLGNTIVQADNAANGILKNSTIFTSLKYLSNFCKLELSLNSGSAQVQTLLAACQRFAMVRISYNDLGWK